MCKEHQSLLFLFSVSTSLHIPFQQNIYNNFENMFDSSAGGALLTRHTTQPKHPHHSFHIYQFDPNVRSLKTPPPVATAKTNPPAPPLIRAIVVVVVTLFKRRLTLFEL